MRIAVALGLLLSLSGCLAKTALDIVTLPVKVVSAGVDAVTTSQSEADEKRGREIRKQEEQAAKEERRAKKEHEHDQHEARDSQDPNG